MSDAPRYEVFAIRYARRDGTRAQAFVGGDAHDGPLAMDYFVWLIRGHGRTVVVDAGFTSEVAARRGRETLCDPVDALVRLGVDPANVHDVVLTHLHYDHVGHLHRFPAAEFHLQESELHFAVGRHMRHAWMRHPFETEDVVDIVRLNHLGRVRLHTGTVQLAPGISLHRAPGHSAGLQFVRVETARGAVVIASDAAHYYENIERGRPFPVCVDVAASFDSYAAILAAAASPAHVVPGHDPEVMWRYPAAGPGLEGIAVRLDASPCREKRT